MQIHGSTLKTMVIRADQKGNTAVSLFVKDEEFPAIDELPISVQGIVVYYSTPKSPASVMTRKLYSLGNTLLSDNINNTKITYDVNSFFQVNIEVFNLALQKIGQAIGIKSFIDMYSGVGTIGLGLGMETEFLLVESNVDNTECALINARNTNAKVIQATAETALEYITNDRVLIVDPPRAGLHHKVVKRILDVKPLKVVYLSCNPITQARDLAILQEKYKISELTGYNFFPKTPHIESLAILELKNR
jgi:23S rRNA (uracil1939-C5)-methyltransferase